MDLTIYPAKLQGAIQAIPSKSQAHRLLIGSAFADGETDILCQATNEDIEATAACLRAMGAQITRNEDSYHVRPISQVPAEAVLPCRESGSTLRFLLPVAGALGIRATFCMEGRLPDRPLSPLWEEMGRMGCKLSRPSANTIRLAGKLTAGTYRIPGNVSSQYISGLMFALPLISGKSQLEIMGKVESAPYISMTEQALDILGPGISSPGVVAVEGDWSNAAFFLAARALGSDIQVEGLNQNSSQGDRAVRELLPQLSRPTTIDASHIPDLIPILSIVAAGNQGACFTNIQRLRLKESDRVQAIIHMITALGGSASATDSTLTVLGTGLRGGTVDSCNDHRIAMSAAIGATICDAPVTILNAQCVNKSYPSFWSEYRKLGGSYEQYIRE